MARTDAGARWKAPIRLVNPTNHYRFLLLTPDSDHPYVWFHAAGLADLAHQAAADMRATMRQVQASTGRELWLVAEHGHDASGDLTGTGWQGTMNYHGFTRPL